MKSYIVRFELKTIGTVGIAVSAHDELEAIYKALNKDAYVQSKMDYYLDNIEVIKV